MTTVEHAPQAHDRKVFIIRVNGQSVEMHEPKPTGEAILIAAGFCSPHQQTLIQLLERESRAIAPHQNVPLKGEGIEEFRVFDNGAVYFAEVDDGSYAWGSETISEADLRYIASVPANEAIEQQVNRTWVVVQPGTEANLAVKGVEKFRTVARLITVFFEGEPFHIEFGRYTTERLKEIFKVQAGYELTVLRDGGLVVLKPQQEIEVCDGMRFSEQTPCGQSS